MPEFSSDEPCVFAFKQPIKDVALGVNRRTRNLRAAQLLLGHTKLESTESGPSTGKIDPKWWSSLDIAVDRPNQECECKSMTVGEQGCRRATDFAELLRLTG
jgi:hypothetical protein